MIQRQKKYQHYHLFQSVSKYNYIDRMAIAHSLQKKIRKEFHKGNPDMSRMKS